jgi:hypothetical protein
MLKLVKKWIMTSKYRKKKREYCLVAEKKQTEIFNLGRKELFLQFRI